jgi:branched-chain amino acid transport system permease protein/urea transport system permease protein
LNSLYGAVLGAGIIGGATSILSSGMAQATAQIGVFLLAIVLIRLFPQGISKGSR